MYALDVVCHLKTSNRILLLLCLTYVISEDFSTRQMLIQQVSGPLTEVCKKGSEEDQGPDE